MQGRKIHAPVLADFFSASSSTPSTSAFCAEYGMVGVPRGGMSSVFRHLRLAGSNGRRAIPTIRFTRRERSSADTRAIPRSPVGPVTATVSPSWGTGVLYRVRRPWGGPSVDRDLLAALQHVHFVGHDRVRARTAPHHVALAVVHI